MKGALGISLLSFPFAASLAGWLPVLLLMPLVFVGVRFGSMLLMDLEHALGRRSSGKKGAGPSFGTSVTTLPSLGGEVGGPVMFWGLQAIITLTQVGQAAAYLIFIASNLQSFEVLGRNLTLDGMIVLTLASAVPLIMVRRLTNLQLCSFVGLVALLAAIVALAIRFATGPPLGIGLDNDVAAPDLGEAPGQGSGDVTGGSSSLAQLAIHELADPGRSSASRVAVRAGVLHDLESSGRASAGRGVVAVQAGAVLAGGLLRSDGDEARFATSSEGTRG